MPGRGRHAPRLPLRHRARRAPRGLPPRRARSPHRAPAGCAAAEGPRRRRLVAPPAARRLADLRRPRRRAADRAPRRGGRRPRAPAQDRLGRAGVRGRAPRPSPAAARRAVASHLGHAQGAPARAARRGPRALGVPRRARGRPRRRPRPPAAGRRDRRRRPARARGPRGARRDAGVPRAGPAPPGRSLVVGDRPRPRAGPHAVARRRRAARRPAARAPLGRQGPGRRRAPRRRAGRPRGAVRAHRHPGGEPRDARPRAPSVLVTAPFRRRRRRWPRPSRTWAPGRGRRSSPLPCSPRP